MAIIEKKKLSEKVVDEIKHRIETGQLKVGDKLPNQNKLASELGVSRTSLREAMNILALFGVIEQRPGYGTVIRKKMPRLEAEGMNLSLMSNRETTQKMIEARLILECGAARLAADQATDEQIRELARIIDKMESCLKRKDYAGYTQLDFEFHELIVTSANNYFISLSVASLKQYMQQFIEENIQLLPGLLTQSQAYHRLVYKAILNRDPDGAEKEMEKHIGAIKETYDRYHSSAL